VNTPSTSVSPGLGGFLAFFLLAVALWLLMRNMNKRMRRMTYREQQEAALKARREGAPADPDVERTDGDRGNGDRADGAAAGPDGLRDDRSGRGPTDPGPGGTGPGGPDRTPRPGA
jgi:hypothetical protein